MASKLVVDIGTQIFNPFLSLIASGLGVSVVELGRVVGLRNVMGIFSPLSGVWADRAGHRLVIRVALLVMAAGSSLIAFSSALWMVAAGIILMGLGTTTFVPNLQAFVSGHLPYNLRARGLGMIEYSWALTGIFGLSLAGVLIAATGWRTPFMVLAAGMVLMSVVFSAMPGEQHQKVAPSESSVDKRSLLRRLASILLVGSNKRSTYATILAATLSFFAAMQVMITYGAWLAGRYALEASQLGFVALVLGCFDLLGSVAVSVFTDRIGKKRSVLIGLAGSLAAYLAMPFFDAGVIQAVVVIAVARMFFEFNIVSHFPLLSEQVPLQRGQVMTLSTAVTMLGATLSGFTGPWLYVNVGLHALAWTSGAAVGLALVVVVLFVRERV